MMPAHPTEGQDLPMPAITSTKRRASALDDEDPSQCSQPSPSKRKPTYNEQDPVLRAKIAFFKAEENEAVQRQIWRSWDSETRAFAMHRFGTPVRNIFKKWKKEEENEAQASRSDTTSQGDRSSSSILQASPEEQAHDWKEGSRIGEADNPGPKGHNLVGSRVPNVRHNNVQTPARLHGTRAVSQASAGERTKGIHPGPNPSVDHPGNVPGGNGTAGNSISAAMITLRSSRVESVQRNLPSLPPNRTKRNEGGQRAAGHVGCVPSGNNRGEEGGPEAATTSPSSTWLPNSREQQAHDWKEGARIGEASNPGPKGRGRAESRVPNKRHSQVQTPAKWQAGNAAPPAPLRAKPSTPAAKQAIPKGGPPVDVVRDILKGLQRLERTLHKDSQERTQVGTAVSRLMRLHHVLTPAQQARQRDTGLSLSNDNQWVLWGAQRTRGPNQQKQQTSLKQHPSPTTQRTQGERERHDDRQQGGRPRARRPKAGGERTETRDHRPKARGQRVEAQRPGPTAELQAAEAAGSDPTDHNKGQPRTTGRTRPSSAAGGRGGLL
jgi:hypothetical protein